MRKICGTNKIKNAAIIAAAVILMTLMAVFPKITECGFKTAFTLWINSVVPVLLPFFIFSDFVRRIGSKASMPVHLYPFAMAVLSGYPTGAGVVGNLIAEGELSEKEGKAVLSSSFVTGPAFILGVTSSFIGDSKAAYIVLVSHYAGALLNGFIYRKQRESCENHKRQRKAGFEGTGKSLRIKNFYEEKPLLESFTLSIAAGFRAMMMILAFLVFFIIGIDFLDAARVFSLLGSEIAAAVLKGLLEMTVGINAIGMCNIGLMLKTVLTAFIVSFGGLSVIAQASSLLAGSGISVGDILRIKLFHGLLAGLTAFGLVLAINFVI